MIKSGKSVVISFGVNQGLFSYQSNRCFTRLAFWRLSIIWYNFDIDYWLAGKMKVDAEALKEYFYSE